MFIVNKHNIKGNHMQEQYVDIKGYEGSYQISNLGNVKSLPNSKRNSEKILSPDIKKETHTSYYRVALSKNGEVTRYQVHRLVASAFIPNHENKPFVNHIDNDGTNNSVTNLEWCTHSENMIHAQKQGRLFETQSKAGTQNKINYHMKVVSEVNQLIGNTFGDLLVLGCNQDAFDKHGKHLVFCECMKCGQSVTIPYTSLRDNKQKQCKGCSIRDANDLVTQETVERLKDTIISNWVVSDKYRTVRPMTTGDKKPGRITFVQCTCATCGFNTVTIKLRSLETKAYLPRCIVCDNDHTQNLHE